MSELTSLTIAEARDKLRAKDITATELTEAYLSAIDAANDQINAYIKVTPEKALAAPEDAGTISTRSGDSGVVAQPEDDRDES